MSYRLKNYPYLIFLYSGLPVPHNTSANIHSRRHGDSDAFYISIADSNLLPVYVLNPIVKPKRNQHV